MGRDIDRSPEQPPQERGENRSPENGRRPNPGVAEPVRAPEQERPAPEQDAARSSRQREGLALDRPCRISPAERETLAEIGRFRTVALEDLARYQYAGDRAQMMQDLRSLRAQGFLQRRTIWTGGRRDRMTVLALTRRGKEIVSSGGLSDQRIYAGLVKPAEEVQHDAAIYRMYQSESKRIERGGGRVRRIVLDYELKQKVFAPLAKAKAKAESVSREYARRQAEVARENGLKVVRGKILLPDLRIEFERANGERAHIDLELATHHYRGSQMRTKAEAGFKMYASQDSIARLSAALDDPGIVAEILSL